VVAEAWAAVRVPAVWAVRVPQEWEEIVCAQNADIVNRMNEEFPVCKKSVRNADQL